MMTDHIWLYVEVCTCMTDIIIIRCKWRQPGVKYLTELCCQFVHIGGDRMTPVTREITKIVLINVIHTIGSKSILKCWLIEHWQCLMEVHSTSTGLQLWKKKVSSGIVTYWMLKNLVLVTPSGGKCIPDGKDWLACWCQCARKN